MIGRFEYLTRDAVDTEHTLTLPAQGLGMHWVIISLEVLYDGTPPTGDITITGLDAPTVFPILTATNRDNKFSGEAGFFIGLENTAIVITVPAGSGSVRSLVYLQALKVIGKNIEKILFSS